MTSTDTQTQPVRRVFYLRRLIPEECLSPEKQSDQRQGRRVKNSALLGTVAIEYNRESDRVRVAYSLVSPKDQFERVVGRAIALGRLDSGTVVGHPAAKLPASWLMETVLGRFGSLSRNHPIHQVNWMHACRTFQAVLTWLRRPAKG
jgi:hypothetical protein